MNFLNRNGMISRQILTSLMSSTLRRTMRRHTQHLVIGHLHSFLRRRPRHLQIARIISDGSIARGRLLVGTLRVLSQRTVTGQLKGTPIGVGQLGNYQGHALAEHQMRNHLIMLFSTNVRVLIRSVEYRVPHRMTTARYHLSLHARRLYITSHCMYSAAEVDRAAYRFFPAVSILSLVGGRGTFLVTRLALSRRGIIRVQRDRLNRSLILRVSMSSPIPIGTLHSRILGGAVRGHQLSDATRANCSMINLNVGKVSAVSSVYITGGLVLIRSSTFRGLPVRRSPVHLLCSASCVVVHLLCSASVRRHGSPRHDVKNARGINYFVNKLSNATVQQNPRYSDVRFQTSSCCLLKRFLARVGNLFSC